MGDRGRPVHPRVVRRCATQAASRRNDTREALEAQRRKRFELDARDSNVELPVLNKEEDAFPLQTLLANFLKDIRAFRKPLTYQKYEHILELFYEYVAPKADARQITTDDVKRFLAWRKSKGFDPGTTLYTDRVILHNFFSKLKLDNPVKDVPASPPFPKEAGGVHRLRTQEVFRRVRRLGEGIFCFGALERLAAGRVKNTALVRPGPCQKACLRYRKGGIPIHAKRLGRTERAPYT
jgi:hypothetical protein